MLSTRGGLLLIATLGLVFGACASARGASTETTIGIRYSHFAPDTITARAGEPLTITLRNDDPIEHEWIVGTEEVHERHRTGTEPYHAEVPSEVTVPALSTRVTTLTFAEPGDYVYICHLPGHEAYGMVGTLHVE
jgi:uncharacterized cupredoxin-like copper-binding protein